MLKRNWTYIISQLACGFSWFSPVESELTIENILFHPHISIPDKLLTNQSSPSSGQLVWHTPLLFTTFFIEPSKLTPIRVWTAVWLKICGWKTLSPQIFHLLLYGRTYHHRMTRNSWGTPKQHYQKWPKGWNLHFTCFQAISHYGSRSWGLGLMSYWASMKAPVRWKTWMIPGAADKLRQTKLFISLPLRDLQKDYWIFTEKNQVSQISCQISQEQESQSETLSLHVIFHSPLSKVTLWFTTLKLEDTDGFSHVSTKRTSYWEYLQYLNGQRRCSFVSSTAANPIDNWLNLW
jgi:hypothetical protein